MLYRRILGRDHPSEPCREDGEHQGDRYANLPHGKVYIYIRVRNALTRLRQNHTMIRIKDNEKSLAFYQDVMGMRLLRTSEMKEAGFTLYFLGYGAPAPEHSANGVNPVADREGVLELTWNYGTEKDESFKYHDGNAKPQGFGHICVSVDDLDAACERFESKKVQWKKRLTEGRMKDVAFVLGESI